MTANELRTKYLEFFKSKGHTIIPSASLVPENDPSVLFTTAGMHPLVPYLMGESHPGGKRVANVQKCVRTGDIDEVGDATHHTFFEMAGNWSFGDYFKKEAIEMSFEFLTDKKWLGLDKNRLAVSVFAGDEDAPFDDEAFNTWKNLGIPEKRIAKLPKKNNWWGMETGPCGPDTEMFFWAGDPNKVPESFNDDNDLWVEIWNDVFMQYDRKKRVILADGINCLIDEKDLKVNNALANMLKMQKARVIVVTNFEKKKIENIVQDLGFELFTLEHRIEKNDSKYFEELFKTFNLSKNEVLYFEHNKESLSGGIGAGITSILYESVESTQKFIAENLYYYAVLKQKNVDTGMGLIRVLAAVNGLDDNYHTEIFAPVIAKIEELSDKKYADNKKSFRIIADHIQASTFIIADGVEPSNTGQGYVLRRLIRDAIKACKEIGLNMDNLYSIVNIILQVYSDYYRELKDNDKNIYDILGREIQQILYNRELHNKIEMIGEKQFNDSGDICDNFDSVISEGSKNNFKNTIIEEYDA